MKKRAVKNNFKIRLTILLLGLFSTSEIFSQTTPDTLRNQPSYLPVPDLISKYEELHSMRIYYQPEWFEGKNLAISNLKRSPDDFLYLISQTGKCSFIFTDSTSVVFVTSEVTSDAFSQADISSTLLVGNMKEFGKYRKAVMAGTVTDGKTGETLPGVSIFIDKLKLGTTTDKSGQYQMEIPVGEYDVRFSFIGFEPSTRHIRLVSNGNANFELFDKSVFLQEVVVTLDRAEFNVTRTQMSLIKLDIRSIKELPVSLGELDIMKSISLLPGIQSSGEFGTGLFVRGGSADQNLILIEEVPVFNASHLFGLTSIVNPDNIAGVTLLKAGIPARYGERSSSVMDIRLGSANQEKIKVRGGLGLLNSKISLNLPVGNKLNLLFGARSSYSNWLLHKMPDVDLMNSSAGFYDLNGLLSYTINPNNRINLFGYVSNDRFSIQKKMDYAYGNILGSVKWNHILSKTLSSVLVAGFSKYAYLTSELDTFRREAGYKMNSSVLYKNLKYNMTWIPVRSHALDLGVSGISYSVSPGNLHPYDSLSLIVPLRLQTEQALEYAFYASDNITISPRLSAEIGIRYSGYASLGPGSVFMYDPKRPRSEETITDTLFYGKNKPVKTWSGIEPRLSVRYSFNDLNSIKLSFTRMRQYINLISNTTVMNPADIWKLSNNYVNPLVCDQLAAGYFHNFLNNAFETSVEVYYKKLNHIIEYKNGATLILNPSLEDDLLDASGYNYGAELYVRKNSGRLTGWLSYAYSKAQRHTHGFNKEEQVNGNRYFPSSYDQPHSMNMVGNYHISRRWRFSWTFTYSTGRPVTLPELSYIVGDNQLIYYSERNKYRLPDYHRMDIAITCDESLRQKKFWKGSWTLSVINLYGRKNKYSVFFQKDPPIESSSFRHNSLYSLYIIGRPLPALTYNFTF
jgi:hypothetical protein